MKTMNMEKTYRKGMIFFSTLFLLGTLMLVLSGCESAGAVSLPDENLSVSHAVTDSAAAVTDSATGDMSPEETVSAQILPALSEISPARQDAGMTMFSGGGIAIPVPTEYLDRLDITIPGTTSGENETVRSAEVQVMRTSRSTSERTPADDSHAETLFTCRVKSAYTPYTDSQDGWLFSIRRLDQVGFEQWMSGDGAGANVFAKDPSGFYYMTVYPADTRFDRDANPSDEWDALNEWSGILPWEILICNDSLNMYDPFDLYRMDYTYEGTHMAIAYTPYEPDEAPVTLILSQPVKHGEGGIWCVERVRYLYEDWTDTQLIFPAAWGIDLSADEYYAAVQSDASSHPELLTPMGAAMDFVRNGPWGYPDAQEQDLTLLTHP